MTRRTWRAAACTAALLVCASIAPTSAAKPTPGALVLSGRGGSYVDITLTRSATVVPMHLAAALDEDGHPRYDDGWSWTGCGAKRGFYLRPLTGDPLSGVGAVDFAELRYGPASDLPLPGGPIPREPIPFGRRHLNVAANGQSVPDDTGTVLRPGRYRAFLLGEGTCQVRVPLGGYGRTLRATASRPASFHGQVSTLRPAGLEPAPGVPMPRAMVVTVPLTIRPATFAFALLHRVGYQVSGSTLSYSTCVETDPSQLCQRATPLTPNNSQRGEYRNRSSAQPPPGAGLPVSVTADATHAATWYAPSWLPAGSATAKVSAVSDQTTALQAVTFALDL
ncbi:MAG TPA: hypothetical protein VNQ77_17630 [Frankiaceae bacterium]|nr:hypothetical protein [Frankiaceae bacterium]